MARRTPSNNKTARRSSATGATTMRIIGGQFGGRKISYSGDTRTRPMKERLREAIFNLIGPSVKGCHAIDLFAGTGALALEALSRGAQSVTCLEQHRPTAETIRQNAAALGVESSCEIVMGDTFIWVHRNWAQCDLPLPRIPWLVFVSPPYDFYVDRREPMLDLIQKILDRAPPGSALVVEADGRFDFELLPHANDWNVRSYSLAVVGIYRVPESAEEA